MEEIQEALSELPGNDLSAVCDSTGFELQRAPKLRNSTPCTFDPNTPTRYADITVQGESFRTIFYTAHLPPQLYTIQVATSTRHISTALNRLRWLLLLSVPVVLIIASSGGYWLSLRAMAPVDAITRTARTIGSQNLSQRLPVARTGDSLERLSVTLNEMFGRLENSFQRISQFTADAAHELRTPLALIRTTAEVALRSGQPDEYKEALPQIIEETGRTTELVKNLLMLARADGNDVAQEVSTFDLPSVIEEVIEPARKLANGRNLDLSFPSKVPAIQIRADRMAIRRLIVILLDNAIQYTPPGGKVSVHFHESILEVKDTGIGISRSDLPHIFERFYRADKARSRESGGAGLGLSLAKWIAESHGTEISVESQLGQGATFRIDFHNLKQS